MDVFKNGSWSGVQRAAGLQLPAPGPNEDKLTRGLKRLLHIDDPIRLDAYRRWLAGGSADPRLITALLHTLWTDGKPATLDEAQRAIQEHPAIIAELSELIDLLEQQADHLTVPTHIAPLSIHARHSLVEILSAFGVITADKFFQPQAGVYFDEPSKSDLFFVTLEKSERDYSPTTLYKDYAISPTLFHWESQSATAEQSATGQRYINHRERGTQILLFVRQRRALDGQTMPYTFLGPADYVSHQQERPIQFVWRLRPPMPADFFRQAKVAAG